MKMNLTTITPLEIDANAVKVSVETNTPIMYLHNNGKQNSRWNFNDLKPWFEEDMAD